MGSIPADYLGGDPDRVSPAEGGTLTYTDAGSFVFAMLNFANPMAPATSIDVLELTADQVQAISVGDANHMRSLTRGAAGVMLGGAIGGLVGMATGKRSSLLVIAAERDGFSFPATFAVQGEHGMALVTEVQAGRKARGESPLPKLEDLAQQAAAAAADEHLQVLRDIRSLLVEQNALLRERQ